MKTLLFNKLSLDFRKMVQIRYHNVFHRFNDTKWLFKIDINQGHNLMEFEGVFQVTLKLRIPNFEHLIKIEVLNLHTNISN